MNENFRLWKSKVAVNMIKKSIVYITFKNIKFKNIYFKNNHKSCLPTLRFERPNLKGKIKGMLQQEMNIFLKNAYKFQQSVFLIFIKI